MSTTVRFTIPKRFHVIKRFAPRALAAVAAMGMSITLLPSAARASPDAQSLEALLTKVAPEARGDLYNPVGTQRSDTPSASVPTTLGKPVISHGEDGTDLSILLPETASVKPDKVAGTPITTFDHGNESMTVPLPKNDGSVQILTILDDATAPEPYSFDIGLPEGAVMKELDEGYIEIVGADGEFIGGVAPAWAKDANDADVPTRYEIDGSTLTQVVDHADGDYTYPLVADPWLGQDLYYSPYGTYPSQGYKINVTPRTWGRTWTGPPTWWAHRDEVKSKLGNNSWHWTNTVQEQFYCHIAGLPASLPQYNLESWRPLVSWAESLAAYRCNPYDGAWS